MTSGTINYMAIPGLKEKMYLSQPVTPEIVLEQVSEFLNISSADIISISRKGMMPFARQKRKGWDVWGNEVGNSIDLFYQPSSITQISLL